MERILAYKEKRFLRRRNLMFDHSKTKGHSVDQCFKIHGYPDWCKGDKGKSITRMVAQVVYDSIRSELIQDNPLAFESCSQCGGIKEVDFVQAICNKVLKALKGKVPVLHQSVVMLISPQTLLVRSCMLLLLLI